MAKKKNVFSRVISAIKGEPQTMTSEYARKIGSITSEAKAKASRENGKLGGRPVGLKGDYYELTSEDAKKLGSMTSEAKAQASRENGKKGGRPKGSTKK